MSNNNNKITDNLHLNNLEYLYKTLQQLKVIQKMFHV
jgi:hypothetical protein